MSILRKAKCFFGSHEYGKRKFPKADSSDAGWVKRCVHCPAWIAVDAPKRRNRKAVPNE